MNDNALFSLIRTTMRSQMPARGLPVTGVAPWDVVRNFQPQQQGANINPTVYLHKIGDRRHGSPQRKYVYDAQTGTHVATESAQYETTFQASILLTETTDPAGLTASDAAAAMAAIMQSDETLAALKAAGVGILRVQEAKNPYDVNDRDQFQSDPSFDFVLTHRRDFVGTAPSVVTVEGNITRV